MAVDMSESVETAHLLCGVSGLLKSTWPALPAHDRNRLLTDLMAGAATLRRSLEGTNAGADGPTDDEVLDELHRATNTLHFQPIVGLPSREVVGFEVLTRFGRWTPDRWFRRAWQIGVGLEFELSVLERALPVLDRLPAPMTLAINVSPLTLISPELHQAVGSVDASRIVLELTEHERISEYPVYREQLTRLRSLGVRIAVDDAGAGHSSLRHILQLAPDTVKLDRDLTAGCDADAARRSLIRSLVGFTSETGMCMVAEGIETEEESAALVSFGVTRGQGYLFGAPAALPTW